MAQGNALSREKGVELGCSLGEGGVKLEREKGEKKSPAGDYHGRHHHHDDGIWLTTSYVSVTDFWSSRTCVVLTNDHNMSHDSIGQI